MTERILITEFFDDLEDPRMEGKCDYPLQEIIAITICAVISGYETFKHIAIYAEAKKGWLSTWLPLKNGVPTQHTFGRVFALLDPGVFEEGFRKWVNSVRQLTDGEVVAIDGKTVRRSHNHKANKKAVHIVSAWAHENGLVLGQVKTDDKSNEITAIPELLETLNLSGCIVTLDAMGCQKKIVKKIVEQDADYVICLKGNQGKLRDHVEKVANDTIGNDLDDCNQAHLRRVEKGHGRQEIRDYWIIDDANTTGPDSNWANLRCFGVARNEVTSNGKTTVDTRYFITSLACKVKNFARAVRAHWSIENTLHWSLDVTFREDESRIRIGHAPENMSVVRRLALSALKQTPPPPKPPRKRRGKVVPASGKPREESVSSKRKLCALNDQYLETVLQQF